MKPPKSRNAWRSLLIRLSCLTVSLLVAALLGEILIRILVPQNIVPRYVESAPWGIRKNIGGVSGRMITPEYTHDFHTNSQGFRGTREYARAKPPGTYRAIVLGDSVALGYGVEDHEAFSAVLESCLSAHHPAEVINMGISGFGTAEELIQLNEVALKYQPDLIILGYFTNDPYNNAVCKLYSLADGAAVRNQNSFNPAISTRDSLYRIPGYSFLSQHSHLVNLLRGKASGFFLKKLGAEAGVTDTTGKAVPDDARALTKALLTELARTCNENNLRLLILNIPLFAGDDVITNLPFTPAESPEGSVTIDVARQIYANHPSDELAYPTDCHPKPAGHRLIGEWLASYLQAEAAWSRFPANPPVEH